MKICPALSINKKYHRDQQLKVKMKVSHSCPTLCDPMDYTVHGILQARIPKWVAFPFSRGSSQPTDSTQVSCFASRFFASWATRLLSSKCEWGLPKLWFSRCLLPLQWLLRSLGNARSSHLPYLPLLKVNKEIGFGPRQLRCMWKKWIQWAQRLASFYI